MNSVKLNNTQFNAEECKAMGKTAFIKTFRHLVNTDAAWELIEIATAAPKKVTIAKAKAKGRKKK